MSKSYAVFSDFSRDLIIENRLGTFNAYKINKILSADGITYIDYSKNGYFYIPELKAVVTNGKGGKAKTMTPDKYGKLNFREFHGNTKFAATRKADLSEILYEAKKCF